MPKPIVRRAKKLARPKKFLASDRGAVLFAVTYRAMLRPLASFNISGIPIVTLVRFPISLASRWNSLTISSAVVDLDSVRSDVKVLRTSSTVITKFLKRINFQRFFEWNGVNSILEMGFELCTRTSSSDSNCAKVAAKVTLELQAFHKFPGF